MTGSSPSSLARAYREDGVVLLPQALDAVALADARAAWDWSLHHPGPGARRFDQRDADAVFYNDLANPEALAAYRPMLQASPLPRLITAIWGAPAIWFFYEQVFLKDGGHTRRTPWHQDSSYLAIGGEHLAVAWITFETVEARHSLEFVRGSHRGLLFNGSRFELGDDTAPLHPGSALPRLPDIEAHRGDYDIVSFAVAPGDVVLFHPRMLHGGAATGPGQSRRTLTLRFFGADAVYERRDGPAGPAIKGFHQRLAPGDPFRDPSFLDLSGEAAQ
ncbi:MAG TPA: phytanoyl-CoA dioxygenase family protein [Caulobacteraceae bacterium]|nr:phytanoyl-CoA dioxygenase family protein [Caulobacteraceae bacterium]